MEVFGAHKIVLIDHQSVARERERESKTLVMVKFHFKYWLLCFRVPDTMRRVCTLFLFLFQISSSRTWYQFSGTHLSCFQN